MGSGSVVWELAVSLGALGIQSSPTVGPDGTVYVGNYNSGELYAVNGGSGELLWQTTGITGVGPSVVLDPNGVVYVSSPHGNTVYAVAPSNGSILWASPNAGGGTELIVGPANLLYSGRLCAMYTNNGSMAWTQSFGGTHGALAPNGILYWSWEGYGINAYDSMSGSRLWFYQTGGAGVHSSFALGKDGTVYVGTLNDRFYGLDGETGVVKWVDPTVMVSSGPAIGANGLVYVVSNDGSLIAYN